MVIQGAKELKPIFLVETASLKSERVEPKTNAIPRPPDFLSLPEEQGANILSTPLLRNEEKIDKHPIIGGLAP